MFNLLIILQKLYLNQQTFSIVFQITEHDDVIAWRHPLRVFIGRIAIQTAIRTICLVTLLPITLLLVIHFLLHKLLLELLVTIHLMVEYVGWHIIIFVLLNQLLPQLRELRWRADYLRGENEIWL